MTSRRQFLKTMGGVTLLTIVPRNVLGKGMLALSDELTKGISAWVAWVADIFPMTTPGGSYV